MNSKFLLPITLFFFLFSCQVALSRDQKNNTVIAASNGNAQHLAPPNNIHLPIELIPFEFPQGLNKASHAQPALEDGKMHSYHFSRLNKRRWRLFYCLAAKFILLLAHIGLLICSYLHLTA